MSHSEHLTGHLRRLWVITLLLAGTVFLTRIYFDRSSPLQYFSHWLRLRVIEAMDNLPEIAAKPGRLILVLGPSQIEVAFDPEQLDRNLKNHGIEATSYNLGFRDIGATLIEDFAKRINYEFQTHHRKADLIVVQLTASRITEAAANNPVFHSLSREFSGLIFKGTPLTWQGFFRDPERVLHDLLTAYAYNGESAEWVTAGISEHLYNRDFQLGPIQLAQSPQEKKIELAHSLWTLPELHPEPAWDPETRGRFKFGSPASDSLLKPLIQLQGDPVVVQANLQRAIDCCDVVDTKIDWRLVGNFIGSLRLLKQVSKKVAVVYTADDPTIPRSEAAQRRVTAVLDLIKKKQHVAILDYSEPGLFNSEDYFDLVHFSDAGQAKFMNLLSRDAELLLQ